MKMWPARLSHDGDRVLCGWTDARGRSTCDGTLGWVVETYGVRDMEFQPFYRQARPYAPDAEPLPLEIDATAKERWSQGRTPLPGRRWRKTRDGQRVLVHPRFALPVTLPCPGRQCGRLNLVSAETLTPYEPSE